MVTVKIIFTVVVYSTHVSNAMFVYNCKYKIGKFFDNPFAALILNWRPVLYSTVVQVIPCLAPNEPSWLLGQSFMPALKKLVLPVLSECPTLGA
jgi:hypothetical protein